MEHGLESPQSPVSPHSPAHGAAVPSTGPLLSSHTQGASEAAVNTGSLQPRLLGLTPNISDSTVLGQGPRICISNKVPDDVDSAG